MNSKFHPEWFTDPPHIWDILTDEQKIDVAHARIDARIASLKEQINQLNNEIEAHQTTKEMLKLRK